MERTLIRVNKGDVPSSVHLFTSVLTFLSNSCSTMSKCPLWQAVHKGDVPSSLHLFTSVLTFLFTFIYCLPGRTFRHCTTTIRQES
jgi:hypothetical protein